MSRCCRAPCTATTATSRRWRPSSWRPCCSCVPANGAPPNGAKSISMPVAAINHKHCVDLARLASNRNQLTHLAKQDCRLAVADTLRHRLISMAWCCLAACNRPTCSAWTRAAGRAPPWWWGSVAASRPGPNCAGGRSPMPRAAWPTPALPASFATATAPSGARNLARWPGWPATHRAWPKGKRHAMRCCKHGVEQWQPPQRPALSAWRTCRPRCYRPGYPCRRVLSGSAQAGVPENLHAGVGDLGSFVLSCISARRRTIGVWKRHGRGVIIRVVFRSAICYSRGWGNASRRRI